MKWEDFPRLMLGLAAFAGLAIMVFIKLRPLPRRAGACYVFSEWGGARTRWRVVSAPVVKVEVGGGELLLSVLGLRIPLNCMEKIEVRKGWGASYLSLELRNYTPRHVEVFVRDPRALQAILEAERASRGGGASPPLLT